MGSTKPKPEYPSVKNMQKNLTTKAINKNQPIFMNKGKLSILKVKNQSLNHRHFFLKQNQYYLNICNLLRE